MRKVYIDQASGTRGPRSQVRILAGLITEVVATLRVTGAITRVDQVDRHTKVGTILAHSEAITMGTTNEIHNSRIHIRFDTRVNCRSIV
jgi:hypothetical protein